MDAIQPSSAEATERARQGLLEEYYERIQELEAVLRDVLDSDALTTMEGCECESCAPIMRGRAALNREAGQ